LINAERLSEKYYAKYLKMKKEVDWGHNFDMNIEPERYCWERSSMRNKLLNEYHYRNWISNHVEFAITCEETMRTLKMIENQMDSYFKQEYEPSVPSCRTICGKFIVDMQSFIEGTICKLVNSNLTWAENLTKEMFKNYAKNTVLSVFKENVGAFEEKDSMIKVLANDQTRKLLVDLMTRNEKESRKLEVVDAWYIRNYTAKGIIEYMETHNLTIEEQNVEAIKKALDDKFPLVLKYVRQFRKQLSVIFYLPEEKTVLEKRANVKIEQNSREKKIEINFTNSKGVGKPTITIEKPSRAIQVVKRAENNKFEFISLKKKQNQGEENIDLMTRKEKESRKLEVVDAWHIRNYTARAIQVVKRTENNKFEFTSLEKKPGQDEENINLIGGSKEVENVCAAIEKSEKTEDILVETILEKKNIPIELNSLCKMKTEKTNISTNYAVMAMQWVIQILMIIQRCLEGTNH
jgi:hypothetical protein